MAGVGEALAIVSLVPPALHAIRLLLEDIEGIHNAPTDIKKLKSELDNVEGILQDLQRSLGNERNIDEEFKELVCSKHIEKAVTACSSSCQSFREQLGEWLKHSTDTKVHWWDRAKVGFLGAKKVKALVTELNTCKATISLALNSANFLATGAQYQATRDLLKQKEDEVREEGSLVVAETSSALNGLAQLSLEDDEEEEIDLGSMKGLKKDIKQGRTSIQEYRELLAIVLVKYECRRTGVKVKNVKIRGKNNVVLGIQNMQGKEHEVHVDIEDVLVDGGSATMIGVQNNVDFKGFWNKPVGDVK